MKYLAIYCVPQECGEPYVHIVSLADGQIVKTYDIPEGYYYSGSEVVTMKIPYGEEIIEKTDTNRLPEIGEDVEYKRFKRMVLTEITDVKEEDWCGTKWYQANLHYKRYNEKRCKRFVASKDEFRKQMEEQGIDMTGWCVYKRMKHEIKDFLRNVLPYDIVNIIRC